ncbi:MAG: RNA methyltransferase [Gemmatimonadaceae bacterium]
MTLLTLARDLKRRKARERNEMFVAEGVRTVEELLRSPLVIQGVVTAPSLVAVPRGAALRAALDARGISVLEVGERDFATATGTDSPQGVLAMAAAPLPSLSTLSLAARARILVLDGVQDPGNAGTILRTAAAFGVAATVVMPGTVDVWNAKVVRSAAGALFARPPFLATWAELDLLLRESGTTLWGADAHGEAIDAALPPERLAIAVSNEGAGLSDEMRARVSLRIAVPIDPAVDSLNVAVAAGILLHHFRT